MFLKMINSKIKTKFEVEHCPALSPGVWFDSILTLKIKANRGKIIELEKIIRKELDKIAEEY